MALVPLRFAGILLLALAGAGAFSAAAQAQTVPVQVSKYWCDKLGGSYSGNTCSAPYAPHPGACAVFRALNVDDPAMLAALKEVEGARVCLGPRVAAPR